MQPKVAKILTRVGGATKTQNARLGLSEREDRFMTIEIADKLVKLRKKYGYSQEELANKLGISRQAVSKWERAEASPDTDNLICLAKLYGVSLDELLATDADLDTIIKEQVKDKDKDNDGKIIIDEAGVHITDEDGSSLVINNKGVHINGCRKTMRKVRKSRLGIFNDMFEGVLFLVAAVTYILLGSLLDMWRSGWVVFFLPEIICSTVRAIDKKNPRNFNMPFLATFTFFFVCMVYPGFDTPLWHPMWVVFLAIPVYYSLVSAIRKGIGAEKLTEDEEFEEVEDKK